MRTTTAIKRRPHRSTATAEQTATTVDPPGLASLSAYMPTTCTGDPLALPQQRRRRRRQPPTFRRQLLGCWLPWLLGLTNVGFLLVMSGSGQAKNRILHFLGKKDGGDLPFYTLANDTRESKDIDDDDEAHRQGVLREWEEVHRRLNNNNATDAPPPPSFVHILHSRFMQHQGHLVALARARLLLFEVFCLPSIVQQSQPHHFVWIVKTDPHLDPSILRDLVALLQPHPHFYVVASHVNFLVHPNVTGAWRTSEIRELQQRRIYTGDRDLLRATMAVAPHVLVLETRLDADDGLHQKYLRHVQQEALAANLGRSSHLKYRFWCSRRSLEWHWKLQQPQAPPQDSERDAANFAHDDGLLQVVIRADMMCITPGITVAYGVGVDESEIPVVPHHLLYQQLVVESLNQTTPPCQRAGTTAVSNVSSCLAFVDGFAFDAIRSRTPTSAGMTQVLASSQNQTDEDDAAAADEVSDVPDSAAAAAAIAQGNANASLPQFTPWMQYAYWHFLYDSFGIARHQVQHAQAYLQGDRLYAIAQDNLAGQCTALHSCKDSAKRDLEAILRLTKPAATSRRSKN